MSQQSSDSLFGSVDFQAAEPTEGYDPANEAVYAAEPAPPSAAYRKRSFDIYSMMLILSFIFLTTAAILFFLDVEKY